MGLLANLKLRRKMLIAMAPLALMAVGAALYSSIEGKWIDSAYSELISKDEYTLRRLGDARAKVVLFGQLLYKDIAELDPDRMQGIEQEMDKCYADYKVSMSEAEQRSPSRAKEMKAAEALLDRAVNDARPVRRATLKGDNASAMNLVRAGVDEELAQARLAMAPLIDGMRVMVDRRSEELSEKTHRIFLIAWAVVVLGVVTSIAVTFYIIQSQVVGELLNVQGCIQDLAGGELDQLIPYLDRTNEIGEIIRALRTLQHGAREREMQGWVKSEVAITLQRLQAATDFTEFAKTLLSRLSESIPLLYGAFYAADEKRIRFTRVGAFAMADPGNHPEFALGEGLVGQAAAERRPLEVAVGDNVRL